MNQYTIEELSRICKVSKQSLYNLFSKNQELIKENSKKQNRRIKYNQEVLNFLIEYYGIDKEESSNNQGQVAQNDQERLKSNQGEAKSSQGEVKSSQGEAKNDQEESTKYTKREAELENKIRDLQEEVGRLKQELEKKEAERLELFRQNGALIYTVQQQQQEKMLFLPQRKTLGEKIKDLFKGEKK